MEPKDNPALPIDTIEKMFAAQDKAAGLICGAVSASNSYPNASQAPITLKGIQDMMAQINAQYPTPPPVSYRNPYMPGGILMAISSMNPISEVLKRISYKPGWKILISPDSPIFSDRIAVTCVYEGYESENAAFEPICVENSTATEARNRLAMSLGKSVKQRTRFTYTKSFHKMDIERMNLEQIIKYVIFGTIREAEEYELNRWFKYENYPVFETKESAKW